MRTARSSAARFASRLIDRVESAETRSPTATASTDGTPPRYARTPASVAGEVRAGVFDSVVAGTVTAAWYAYHNGGAEVAWVSPNPTHRVGAGNPLWDGDDVPALGANMHLRAGTFRPEPDS